MTKERRIRGAVMLCLLAFPQGQKVLSREIFLDMHGKSKLHRRHPTTLGYYRAILDEALVKAGKDKLPWRWSARGIKAIKRSLHR